jgi:CspA family cold shock protein
MKERSEKAKAVVYSGECEEFDKVKGFGFLSCSMLSKDTFVHQNDIRMTGFRSLNEQQKVTFEVESYQDDSGRVRVHAVNVRPEMPKARMSRKADATTRCFSCGQFGHLRSQCKNKNRQVVDADGIVIDVYDNRSVDYFRNPTPREESRQEWPALERKKTKAPTETSLTYCASNRPGSRSVSRSPSLTPSAESSTTSRRGSSSSISFQRSPSVSSTTSRSSSVSRTSSVHGRDGSDKKPVKPAGFATSLHDVDESVPVEKFERTLSKLESKVDICPNRDDFPEAMGVRTIVTILTRDCKSLQEKLDSVTMSNMDQRNTMKQLRDTKARVRAFETHILMVKAQRSINWAYGAYSAA